MHDNEDKAGQILDKPNSFGCISIKGYKFGIVAAAGGTRDHRLRRRGRTHYDKFIDTLSIKPIVGLNVLSGHNSIKHDNSPHESVMRSGIGP